MADEHDEVIELVSSSVITLLDIMHTFPSQLPTDA
jgi:hypothetical protein